MIIIAFAGQTSNQSSDTELLDFLTSPKKGKKPKLSSEVPAGFTALFGGGSNNEDEYATDDRQMDAAAREEEEKDVNTDDEQHGASEAETDGDKEEKEDSGDGDSSQHLLLVEDRKELESFSPVKGGSLGEHTGYADDVDCDEEELLTLSLMESPTESETGRNMVEEQVTPDVLPKATVQQAGGAGMQELVMGGDLAKERNERDAKNPESAKALGASMRGDDSMQEEEEKTSRKTSPDGTDLQTMPETDGVRVTHHGDAGEGHQHRSQSPIVLCDSGATTLSLSPVGVCKVSGRHSTGPAVDTSIEIVEIVQPSCCRDPEDAACSATHSTSGHGPHKDSRISGAHDSDADDSDTDDNGDDIVCLGNVPHTTEVRSLSTATVANGYLSQSLHAASDFPYQRNLNWLRTQSQRHAPAPSMPSSVTSLRSCNGIASSGQYGTAPTSSQSSGSTLDYNTSNLHRAQGLIDLTNDSGEGSDSDIDPDVLEFPGSQLRPGCLRLENSQSQQQSQSPATGHLGFESSDDFLTYDTDDTLSDDDDDEYIDLNRHRVYKMNADVVIIDDEDSMDSAGDGESGVFPTDPQKVAPSGVRSAEHKIASFSQLSDDGRSLMSQDRHTSTSTSGKLADLHGRLRTPPTDHRGPGSERRSSGKCKSRSLESFPLQGCTASERKAVVASRARSMSLSPSRDVQVPSKTLQQLPEVSEIPQTTMLAQGDATADSVELSSEPDIITKK